VATSALALAKSIPRTENGPSGDVGCRLCGWLKSGRTFDWELMAMPSRKYITYREWRARGETVLGAALRTVPFQYVWLAMALLAVLSVMYLKPLLKPLLKLLLS
jgi:hypothetical protein